MILKHETSVAFGAADAEGPSVPGTMHLGSVSNMAMTATSNRVSPLTSHLSICLTRRQPQQPRRLDNMLAQFLVCGDLHDVVHIEKTSAAEPVLDVFPVADDEAQEELELFHVDVGLWCPGQAVIHREQEQQKPLEAAFVLLEDPGRWSGLGFYEIFRRAPPLSIGCLWSGRMVTATLAAATGA